MCKNFKAVKEIFVLLFLNNTNFKNSFNCLVVGLVTLILGEKCFCVIKDARMSAIPHGMFLGSERAQKIV